MFLFVIITLLGFLVMGTSMVALILVAPGTTIGALGAALVVVALTVAFAAFGRPGFAQLHSGFAIVGNSVCCVTAGPALLGLISWSFIG